jgi:hypothetical protein
LIDANQTDQGLYKPSEFSIDASFARKFGENLSLGLTCATSTLILVTGHLYLAAGPAKQSR